MGWLIDDLIVSWWLLDLGPLGLDEDIYNARDQCTSYATENTDYLIDTLPRPQTPHYTVPHRNPTSIFPTYLPLHTLYDTPPTEGGRRGGKGSPTGLGTRPSKEGPYIDI